MKITRKIEIEFTRKVTQSTTSDETTATNADQEAELLDELPKGFLTELLGQAGAGAAIRVEDQPNKEK